MNKFIEICQEATHCMRYPQEDSFGWFMWIVWGIIVLTVVGCLAGSSQIRQHVLAALRHPTEYRGRMGRDEFLVVYFSLQVLRVCVAAGAIVLVAFLGKQWASAWVVLGGLVGLMWLTTALYCAIIRRGHDFNFTGPQSLRAYWGRHFLRRFSSDEQGTWQVLCNQKGNPYANPFGSAPQENNYLIPPEKDWRSENREFPNVWDEADWKNMPRHALHQQKRTYWKREEK